MIKKFKNARIRTQFTIILLIAGLLSYLLFSFLWAKLWNVLPWIDAQFHLSPQQEDEAFWDTLYEEALKYDIPESEDDKEGAAKLEPFFDLVDEYTSIYIYGLEDGTFIAGRYAQIMDEAPFRHFFSFGYRVTGGEGEQVLDFPLQFKNGKSTLIITFYHNSRLIYPYSLLITCLSIGFFLCIVLFFISRKMKKVIILKDEVLRMATGDLTHAFPDFYGDEIGILSQELDHLRIAFGETIQDEQESRKANQDLITAMSHDLRTPLTILNGYLEVMKQKKKTEMHEEYLERCLQKTNDIKEMTDRMFEYALVFEEVETPALVEIPVSFLRQCLSENCDYIQIAGFKTAFTFPDTEFLLHGDQTMLKRVFNNLFSNILKYGDKKEPVTITGILEDSRLKITLQNTVKKEYAAVESNHIGLKSVQKIVGLLGGEFLLNDTGQTFSVQLSFSTR